jgi:hypothetical protein
MRLLCLFFSISLTLSSKIIGSVSSALTIYKGGQGSINDVYKILYDTPKSTLYFTNVPSTIQKDSIQFNPNNAEVKVYGVSYNNGAKKEDKLANLKNNINKTISFKSADGKSYRGKLIGYGANFIKIINPLTGKIQQLSGSLQLPSQASQVKPPFIALTASAGYHITSSTNVNYQASGLRWAAFYTLFLNPDQTRANLSI